MSVVGGLVVVACLPFLLAEPDGFKKVLVWSGVPGRGGPSPFSIRPSPERRLSPALALAGDPNDVANWVSRANGVTTIIVLWRSRLPDSLPAGTDRRHGPALAERLCVQRELLLQY